MTIARIFFLMTLFLPLVGQASPVICTKLLTADNDQSPRPPWWARSLNFLQGKASKQKNLTSPKNDEDLRLAQIQEWLQREHGLKVNLQGPLRFNVANFLLEVDRHQWESGFKALSESLKNTSQQDQIDLFNNVIDQVGLIGDALEHMGAGRVLFMSAVLARSEKIGILEAYYRTSSEIQRKAVLPSKPLPPPEFAETVEGWRNGRIHLTPEGTIPYGSDGLPDRYMYELAKKLQHHMMIPYSDDFSGFPADARSEIQNLIRAQRETLKQALADDHYRQLFEIRYSEPITTGSGDDFQNRPIWDFINPRYDRGRPRYRENSLWWASSTNFFEETATGEQEHSYITAKTSQSPAERIYGPDVERVFFWPLKEIGPITGFYQRKRELDTPDLSRIRNVENREKQSGKIISLEVLANYAVGEPPVGFFFVNIGGDFVPAKIFNTRPIEKACIVCHATYPNSGIMSFKPTMLNSAEDYHKAGFRGPAIIQELIKTTKAK